MEILRDILIYLLALGSYWLIAYFQRKGSNNADKSDMRVISYEGKKGGNVADEEDATNQLQKERLMKILYLAEKINQSIGRYVLYFYDNTTRAKFDKLVEDLNLLLTDLYHEQRLANLYLSEEQQKMLEELIINASGVIVEMSTNSTNAATYITIYNEYLQYAREDKTAEAFYWEQAKKQKLQLDELGKKKLMFKDDYNNSIQKYAEWLGEYIKQNIKTI